MPLRLAEIVVPEGVADAIEELLRKRRVSLVARHPLRRQRERLELLCSADETEGLLDAIEDHLGDDCDFRVVLLAVEASIPRHQPEEESDDNDNGGESDSESEPGAPEDEGGGVTDGPPAIASALDVEDLENVAEVEHVGESAAATDVNDLQGDVEDVEESGLRTARIYREEVYDTLSAAAQWTPVYAVTIALSTVVAAIGLIQSSTAVIIGAMVIAPLLGPNMALALGTTLGDRVLLSRSIRTGAWGLGLGFVLALLLGVLLAPRLDTPEIALRTQVSLADVILALASGAAGALGFTTGAPASLIGVMVAVALMPPLVVLGLALGVASFGPALGAGLLLLTNIISVLLAATLTFRLQGLSPRRFWEGARARKMTFIAVALWVLLLLALIILIVEMGGLGEVGEAAEALVDKPRAGG